ncbi:MAG: TetR/AcrR family transcriptional regulator [Acidimicrobiia bacterium]
MHPSNRPRERSRASRLSSEERREHLIKVARNIVAEKGVPAVTMERVAEEGGVSRALVYLHFENAEQVLLALLRQELRYHYEKVYEGMRKARTDEELVRAAVLPYEEAMSEHGSVFRRLVLTHLDNPELERKRNDYNKKAVDFWAERAHKTLGMEVEVARVAATIMVEAISGIGKLSVSEKEFSKGFLTDVYVDLVLEGFRGLARQRSRRDSED